VGRKVIPKNKAQLLVYIDKKVLEDLRRLVKAKYDGMRGISWEVENALRNWIAMHMEGKEIKARRVNPAPRVFMVWRQVRDYIEGKYGKYLFYGEQVSRSRIVEAIKNVRGFDNRTVKKWLNAFIGSGILKPIAPEVFEVLW